MLTFVASNSVIASALSSAVLCCAVLSSAVIYPASMLLHACYAMPAAVLCCAVLWMMEYDAIDIQALDKTIVSS